ncbi:cell division protein FtsX [Roseomonas sp. OT10]|uniref:cell division protein FtsX n=1 Tax=Roseomonas cutis TaxID=2897332 RepID=UPI001E414BA1|nr:FtsX-like permease family protein [Roseomonas sp. OT10]UFN47333.1 cell division protein FtsX [Roseomonas sp. OT10]
MAERRRRSRDPLGLRRALSGRLLPGLVAAMSLLAALALAGAHGAAGLAERWQEGAAAAVTAQVPRPEEGRMALALSVLRASPEVASATPVDPERMATLLKPWLGDAPALPLPGVIEVRLRDLDADPALLARRLSEAVEGAELESHGIWVARLAALARSVQGLALATLALVAGVAAAVVAVATRAGLAARREAIGILYDLGATHGDIAGRFSVRVAGLAAAGAMLGTLIAVPALLALARLAAPFAGGPAVPGLLWESLPWIGLVLLPFAAALIGWLTAQATVRRWLRRLA